MPITTEPTYALQLVRPFWSLLARYPQVPEAIWRGGEQTPDGARVPVADGQRFLAQMVELTGDPDLGLHAAEETAAGAFDVLEYVALSAANGQQALETVFRYIGLMNGAADFRIERQGERARIVLGSTVPLTRAGIDFQSGALFVTIQRWTGELPELGEVWLSYPEPEDVSQHEKTFGGATLRFSAPFDGFVFAADVLDLPLTGADPGVHAVLRAHLERLLAEQPEGSGALVAEVRAALMGGLKDGPPSADAVARGMGISRRTLTRRLSQDGTSYKALLSEVRHRAARRYLEQTEHTVDDIAFLLGFSESSAFVRAFQRWEGTPPAAYRRSHRAG